MTIRAMHAAAVGRASYVSKNTTIADFADRAISMLAERVPALVTNLTLRNKLFQGLREIATEFRDRARKAKDQIQIEPMWAQFMNDKPFRLSLWSSQRVAYLAFFNAYEVFLVDTLKVGLGVTKLRVTDRKKFNLALKMALGTDISGPCWHNNDVNIPRLVRHALSHNGGRMTDDLAPHKHGIALIGPELQILPSDIHRMLKALRAAAEKLLAVTKDNQKFKAPVAKLPQPQDGEE